MLSQYAFSVSTIMFNAYLQISGNINIFMQFCINVTILKVSCLEMAIVPSHMPTSQERTKGNTKSVRNLRSTSHRSQQRSVLVLWTSVVTVTMVVLLITGIIVYIKKRNLINRAGDENQQEDNNVMITT